jgi:Flp pilus assembly protein TadD
LTALTKRDIERGRTAAALARVKAVTDADAKNFLARNLLGELYIASKQPDKAIESFTQATLVAATWPVPYRNIALVKLASKDAAGAIGAYQAGLKATGYDPALATDLASIYESQKRVDDAIRLYDELRQRHPQLDLAANNLAMLLVTYKTDQASLDRARDLSAPFASSSIVAFLDTHGWVRFKRGEFTQAVPVLERAVSESPNSKVLRFHLGMAQYKSGQRDQAISNLERALDGGARFNGADEARSVLTQLKGGSAG